MTAQLGAGEVTGATDVGGKGNTMAEELRAELQPTEASRMVLGTSLL